MGNKSLLMYWWMTVFPFGDPLVLPDSPTWFVLCSPHKIDGSLRPFVLQDFLEPFEYGELVHSTKGRFRLFLSTEDCIRLLHPGATVNSIERWSVWKNNCLLTPGRPSLMKATIGNVSAVFQCDGVEQMLQIIRDRPDLMGELLQCMDRRVRTHLPILYIDNLEYFIRHQKREAECTDSA